MFTVRTLVMALLGASAFTGSAFGNNVALASLGATANASNVLTFGGTTFVAGNAIDGSLDTQWVAPGLTSPTALEPWLLINLSQTFTIDSVTVDGVGNPGLFTSFDVFVGTLAALQNIENNGAGAAGVGATLLLQVMNQPDGTAWSLTGLVPGGGTIMTQYVLYEAVNDSVLSTASCSTTTITSCYPGSAIFNQDTSPLSGQEDAYTTEILVDEVPEPTTIGLFGVAALAFGFAKRRFCKR